MLILPFPTAIAKETKEVVQKEEQEATQKAQMTQEIADSAQRDLDEALPALVGEQRNEVSHRTYMYM